MSKESSKDTTLSDGSLDFAGGVNSYVVTTVQSERNPNGLKRNQVAWLNNCTVRGGGILQRTGWKNNGAVNCPASLYQGAFMYMPTDAEVPYLIAAVAGHIYQVDVDNPTAAVDLSTQFGVSLPADQPYYYFCQAEQFLIIQAGDYQTKPLFWDGVKLWQSTGVNASATQGQQGISFIPEAGPMCYYMGRLWYAQGRIYSAGDIVGGPSGILPDKSDSVLNVTENPLAVGGDGFTVPAGSGNIRALDYTANLNSALGEGQLIIFTRHEIFGLTVPVTRTDWIGAGSGNMPVQTVLQNGNGGVNDRSVVAVNGDLFFQSLEPSIRSLITALRYFDQWGNTPISVNENRILAFNDRALLRFASGILFDNRMLQTALPYVCPVGVAHQAIIPLNFDVVSTLETKLPPVWEGMYEGLPILELLEADFGGLQRAFAMSWSDTEQKIQLWELTTSQRFENGDNRVDWYFETPSFTWGDELNMKKLVSGELWIDKLLGTVIFQVDYRPDGENCWFPWTKFNLCTAKNSCEDVNNPNGCTAYPIALQESYRQTVSLPKPPQVCEPVMARPANIGFQFQMRIRIKGWCRIRGLFLYAEPFERRLYDAMVCK